MVSTGDWIRSQRDRANADMPFEAGLRRDASARETLDAVPAIVLKLEISFILSLKSIRVTDS
jgi:hypothetical protein